LAGLPEQPAGIFARKKLADRKTNPLTSS